MPLVRAEITHHLTGDVPADYATNTVYHTIDDSGFNPSVDYQNHANEIKAVFSGSSPDATSFKIYQGRQIRVVVYNMADARPRPEMAVATYVPTTADGALGLMARQVAIRCSWYCGRNIKGLRGGIYVGPLKIGDSNGGDRVDSAARGVICNLGNGLFNVGGENVAHVLMKTEPNDAAGPTHPITTYWCDDSFDTQRRRKVTPATRLTFSP